MFVIFGGEFEMLPNIKRVTQRHASPLRRQVKAGMGRKSDNAVLTDVISYNGVQAGHKHSEEKT